jgi:hypothetical protein
VNGCPRSSVASTANLWEQNNSLSSD